MNNIFYIVQVDRHDYSTQAKKVEDLLGVNAVQDLNKETQKHVDKGLEAVGKLRQDAVISERGDDAVVYFRDVVDAHNFAHAVHESTKTSNIGKETLCWFSIGCAVGPLTLENGQVTKNSAGDVLTVAARLHKKAEPGEILIEAKVYFKMPSNLQCEYGNEEKVIDNNKRVFSTYRLVVIPDLRDSCKKRILMLPVNHGSVSSSRWDKELTKIRKSITRGSNSDDVFDVENSPYLSLADLPEELTKLRPYIIHIYDYINRFKEPSYENIRQHNNLESQDKSIISLLESYAQEPHAKTVKCVILCGSYSEEQIRKVVNHIEFVISISSSIKEEYLID